MRLKKRVIWGIDMVGGDGTPYINFGEGKYAYVSVSN